MAGLPSSPLFPLQVATLSLKYSLFFSPICSHYFRFIKKSERILATVRRKRGSMNHHRTQSDYEIDVIAIFRIVPIYKIDVGSNFPRLIYAFRYFVTGRWSRNPSIAKFAFPNFQHNSASIGIGVLEFDVGNGLSD